MTVPDAAGPSPTSALTTCRELFEERAAIMTFNGGLPREHAEAQTLAEIV